MKSFCYDPISIIEGSLPLVYSIASALTILHLSRKPVRLDQYSPLNDNYEDDEDQLNDQPVNGIVEPGASLIGSPTVDQVQAQYQAQRSSGLSINLARLGLTAFQLGLALFSLVLLKDVSDGHDHHNGRTTFCADILLILSWVYALTLSFVHVIRPLTAFQFWIRPQLDLFYVLMIALQSIHLYQTDIFTIPLSKLPLWLKSDILAWIGSALLLWVSLVTRPYLPIIVAKKLKEGESSRLPSPEYSSSIYSQLAFAWVNPLVYLGYRRPVQDIDLPDLEITDYSIHSIKRYNLVK